MGLLNNDIQKQVRELLSELDVPVRLVVFTQGEGGALECEMCADTRELITEVAALSPKLSVEVRDFVGDAEIVETYGIDKVPAVAIVRDGPTPVDYGIRLYGIPSGYEFSTLIEDIVMVSRGDPGLSAQTLAALEKLTGPVNIQVFVTPTCPHCPRQWCWRTSWRWPASTCVLQWSRPPSSRTWPTATRSTVCRAR